MVGSDVFSARDGDLAVCPGGFWYFENLVAGRACEDVLMVCGLAEYPVATKM
jgi:hypothetical protein